MALVKCNECGKSISNKAAKCPSCGYPLRKKRTNTNYRTNSYAKKNDEPSIGLNIISFIWPMIGLILYFSIKDDKPERAKSLAITTWASVGLWVFFY